MDIQNTFLVDGVSTVGVHNGVARVQFMRIGVDGKVVNSLELCFSTGTVKSIIDALRKVQDFK